MGTENNKYPGFEYQASELSAFILSIDTFIISLKNGRITHFCPGETEEFKKWLNANSVRDISIDDGVPNTGTAR